MIVTWVLAAMELKALVVAKSCPHRKRVDMSASLITVRTSCRHL